MSIEEKHIFGSAGRDKLLIAEFNEYAIRNNRKELVHKVPTLYLTLLLKSFPSKGVISRIDKMEAALEELKEMEQNANISILQEMILCGNIFTRGRGEGNSEPIVWVRSFREAEYPGAKNEYMLAFFWVVIHARRMQMAHGDPDFIMVFDDFGRPFLDFNLGMLSTFGRICGDLFPIAQNSGQYVFFSSKTQQTMMQTLMAVMPASYKEGQCFWYTRTDVRKLAAKNEDIPEFFGMPESKPFEPEFRSVGNISKLFERQGFAEATISFVHSATLEEMKRLEKVSPTVSRSRSSPPERNDVGQARSSGTFGSRRREMWTKLHSVASVLSRSEDDYETEEESGEFWG